MNSISSASDKDENEYERVSVDPGTKILAYCPGKNVMWRPSVILTFNFTISVDKKVNAVISVA